MPCQGCSGGGPRSCMTGAYPGAISGNGMLLIGLVVGVVGTLLVVNVTGEKTIRGIAKKAGRATLKLF